MGIISAAGTSMSMLTNKGPFQWHPAHQEIKDACAQAAQICKVGILYVFAFSRLIKFADLLHAKLIPIVVISTFFFISLLVLSHGSSEKFNIIIQYI